MIKKSLSRLWHTAKYLRPKQIYYRLYYAFHKLSSKQLKQHLCKQRVWQRVWSSPGSFKSTLTTSGEITFLGESGFVKNPQDWNQPSRSKLWLYNLHYFNLLTTKDADLHFNLHYRFLSQWINDNPPVKGNGWEPYPLSLRIVNIVKWFSKNEARIPAAWLDNLGLQAQALALQIEHHIQANHLFANGKALVFAGTYFQGTHAEKWLKQGLKILDREIKIQFLEDGGHYELSPMYHAALLWDICDLVNLAQCSGLEVLTTRIDHWKGVISKGLYWLNAMSHPDGKISFFNDAAFDIAPDYEDIVKYIQQLGICFPEKNTVPSPYHRVNHLADVPQIVRGIQRSNARASSLDPADKPRDVGNLSLPCDKERIQNTLPFSLNFLKNSGYCIVNIKNQGKAILDIARIGPNYQPGHAHADTLSFELSLFGQRILVNSGTSEYGNGTQRQFERSTAAHNTLSIDNQDSSEVWAGFRVARRAFPKHIKIHEQHDEIKIKASHNGYRRLPGRNIHQRKWHFSPNRLLIHDTVTGNYKKAVSRLYFHPAVVIQYMKDNQITVSLSNGHDIVIEITGYSELSLKNTFWHPRFGEKQKNHCLAMVMQKNELFMELSW